VLSGLVPSALPAPPAPTRFVATRSASPTAHPTSCPPPAQPAGAALCRSRPAARCRAAADRPNLHDTAATVSVRRLIHQATRRQVDHAVSWLRRRVPSASRPGVRPIATAPTHDPATPLSPQTLVPTICCASNPLWSQVIVTTSLCRRWQRSPGGWARIGPRVVRLACPSERSPRLQRRSRPLCTRPHVCARPHAQRSPRSACRTLGGRGQLG
jgi:hypothetical protein